MFKNHLSVSLRTILKQKGYSFINIAGLAIGMACCLLILLYIQHELSYDRYHEKADRIYRVAFSGSIGGGELEFAGVAAPTAQALVTDYPEVLNATRIYTQNPQRYRVRFADKTFIETKVAYADASIFDIFTIPMLAGEPATALSKPNAIVISEQTARKYFAAGDPLGKTLTFDATTDYMITGVFREIPDNTHFHFDFIASLTTLDESRHPGWLNNMSFRTYILLVEGSDPQDLERKFPEMAMKYCAPIFESKERSFEELANTGLRLNYYLQPVTDIHLYSDLTDELEPNGNIKYVYIFSIIAIFVLILACVNFMNLSTARSANRAKEVGIRKAIGASRVQLTSQFLAESVMMSTIALVVAVLLIGLALPYFNNLTGKELRVNDLTNGILISSFFAITVIVGLVAGSYPALFLSSLKPVIALKQKLAGKAGHRMRTGLVVFQFTASIILIIVTVVILEQLQYVQNKKLGFLKEQVLIIHDAYMLGSRVQTFKSELMQNAEVISATVTGYLPVTSHRTEDVVTPDGNLRERGAVVQRWAVDSDYIRTMGMEIVNGRDFSGAYATDSSAMIINEAAVKYFGWDDPIGRRINKNNVDYHVIGVVQDFHYESLREHIGPLLLFLGQSTDFISIRLKTDNLSNTIQWFDGKWNTFTPGQPFAFSFLDDRFEAMYKAEQRVSSILGIFAALAVFIGCLGLFGLASFMAEQKTKEVGIRKMLGATAWSIANLFSRELVWPVVVANVFAWPVAFYAINSVLQNYAYRIPINLWVFFLAGGLALVAAMVTVSFHTVRAALAKPVEALRYE